MKKIVTNGIVLVLAVCVALLIRAKIQRFTVPQNGMYPTIPAGTTQWLIKKRFTTAELNRGDIVVFDAKHEGKNYNFVWRIIGLPGEKISINEQELTIDGTVIERVHQRTEGMLEIYEERVQNRRYEVAYDSSAAAGNRLGGDLVVPEGHFYLLGDNRYNALDSRYIGPIPIQNIFAIFNP